MLRLEHEGAAGAVKVIVFQPHVEQRTRVCNLALLMAGQVLAASDWNEMLGRIRETKVGCVVLDDASHRPELLKLLESFRVTHPGVVWIVFSGEIPLKHAVGALKLGVQDVILHSEMDSHLTTSMQQGMQLAYQRYAESLQRTAVHERFQSLTASERVVLSQVMQGRTNKQVAQTLGRSLRTVESRRQRILSAMQATNAIDLASMLARNDLMAAALGETLHHESQSAETINQAESA